MLQCYTCATSQIISRFIMVLAQSGALAAVRLGSIAQPSAGSGSVKEVVPFDLQAAASDILTMYRLAPLNRITAKRLSICTRRTRP